jgi:hypothetical protein
VAINGKDEKIWERKKDFLLEFLYNTNINKISPLNFEN